MGAQKQSVSRKLAEAHRLEGAVTARLRALTTQAKSTAKVALSLEIVSLYDQLAGAVYRTRNDPQLDPAACEHLESGFTNLSKALLSIRRVRKPPTEPFLSQYRSIFRRDFGLLVACVAIFCGCTLIGSLFCASRPEYAVVMVPTELIEQMIDPRPQMNDGIENTFFAAASLASNNIMLSLKTFAYGALLGVGGLVILCFHGIHLGSAVGYCLVNGFGDQLGEWILRHGPLELSIVLVSTFASVQYGRAFFTRPYGGFLRRLRQGFLDGCTIIVGSVPWLILAGAIEGIINSTATLNAFIGLTLSTVIAALFWVWSLQGCD
jgi:uncharacterized membrane protein SpoIIM required for sporulation